MTILEAADRGALAKLSATGWDAGDDVRHAVADIMAAVRTGGDAELVALTRRFDAPEFAISQLRVAIPETAIARATIPEDVAAALERARDRVRAFHERQAAPQVDISEEDGSRSAFFTRPLAAVGAYVPGGSAILPSSVIMAAVPARIAGVERVVVATPPRRDGTVSPAILFAAALCGVDELYAMGGAQAIAALAYGTQTIARVDKIVGPGNIWVTEAKRQVFGTCAIDGLAGPSEVLVVADSGARPEFVVSELLAQAEHDPLARVALVTDDEALLQSVAAMLREPLPAALAASGIIARVLSERTWLIHARSEDELFDAIETFAPEHLSLQVRDPWRIVQRVRRVGAVFVGEQTPVASGDYLAGSNHVLPTSGAARFSSGLRLADFTRTFSVIENSAARMASDAGPLAAIAEYEGLPAHASSARLRAGAPR